MIKEIEVTLKTNELEHYFSDFRENTIGANHSFESIYGSQKLYYADWVASGRLYQPIEDIMLQKIGPMIANTHSFSSQTGKTSTYGYRYAWQLIRKHVNASESDCLIATGTGMTAAINKLLRIMRLRSADNFSSRSAQFEEQRPVVFITHMEHHSNQVPWYETIADVVVLPCDQNNHVCPEILRHKLSEYDNRKLKIGSFTACSNVTGIITPYHELAKVMHQHGGFCFVDFAASAPYVNIDMHPDDAEMCLDAIFFSPHKFLGGPGSCGILIFNKKLYNSNFPDNPGGGNVKYTNPWGEYSYSDAIEVKEDGGTPGFLQVIRTALCLELKTKMGVEKMKLREAELLKICFTEFKQIKGLTILGDLEAERIGCVSFIVENIHYNLMVRLLNDRFGIQVRGGWSCASTYAHYLLDIDKQKSNIITNGILVNDLSLKPGWIRLSLHPTMMDRELFFICKAVKQIVDNIEGWKLSYRYNRITNEFDHLTENDGIEEEVKNWFFLDK